MAVKYGFYNSLDGDRKYNAMDMGRLFDGIIRDGVFMSIGTALMVEAAGEMYVNVGIGRAWFNSTWTHNDAILPLRLDPCDILLNRIDAVVLECNINDNVRMNDIKIVKGEEASVAVRPTLSKENNCYQYPLAYISIAGTAEEITQANITNMVGTNSTPFVTGILETMDIDALIAQWGAQWSEWKTAVETDNDEWSANERAEFQAWCENEQNTMSTWIEAYQADLKLTADGFKDFRDAKESDFFIWFEAIKANLDENAAGNLQNQINDAVQKEFEHYYALTNKVIEINKEDGVTTSIVETSEEAVCTTTFETTDTGKLITTVIVPTSGNYNYTKTTTIETVDTGKQITESFVQSIKTTE